MTNNSPPKTLEIFGIKCFLDEQSLGWSSYFWQSNQKELLSLSISIRHHHTKSYNKNLDIHYSVGWSIGIEWFNGYNNRIIITSRVLNSLEEAERDVLSQLSKLIDGAKMVNTKIMLNFLNKKNNLQEDL